MSPLYFLILTVIKSKAARHEAALLFLLNIVKPRGNSVFYALERLVFLFLNLI